MKFFQKFGLALALSAGMTAATTTAATIAPVKAVLPTGETRTGIESNASLATMVTRLSDVTADNAELNCLATAIYFEAKSEPLAGQLAVAHVVRNRVNSGRFASSICGVVTQRGQFSFVRGGMLPSVPQNAQWRRAVGVAQVAMQSLHASPVGNALFFHARRVSPSWGKPVVATIGNHIFYR